MKNSVKVSGAARINAAKPAYSTIMVEQTEVKLENGFANLSKRVDFITMKTEIAHLFTAGQELPGKIVRSESLSPFFEGQKAKINPTTKEAILLDGQPVYFDDKYTENQSAQDSLLGSSKVDVASKASVEAAIN
jgi:hypothetical protein